MVAKLSHAVQSRFVLYLIVNNYLRGCLPSVMVKSIPGHLPRSGHLPTILQYVAYATLLPVRHQLCFLLQSLWERVLGIQNICWT